MKFLEGVPSDSLIRIAFVACCSPQLWDLKLLTIEPRGLNRLPLIRKMKKSMEKEVLFKITGTFKHCV